MAGHPGAGGEEVQVDPGAEAADAGGGGDPAGPLVEGAGAAHAEVPVVLHAFGVVAGDGADEVPHPEQFGVPEPGQQGERLLVGGLHGVLVDAPLVDPDRAEDVVAVLRVDEAALDPGAHRPVGHPYLGERFGVVPRHMHREAGRPLVQGGRLAAPGVGDPAQHTATDDIRAAVARGLHEKALQTTADGGAMCIGHGFRQPQP